MSTQYPKRYDRDEIATWNLSKHSRCETCNNSMNDHDYVVMDNLGFVVDCDKNA